MTHLVAIVAAGILLAGVLAGCARNASDIPAAEAGRFVRESIEWSDVWIPQADRPEMPRVLLIGDSITRAYYPGVADRLAPGVSCARLATSACTCDPALELQLRAALAGYRFDVIHINNGLHGAGYSQAEYRAGYERALTLIRRLQPQAKLILALTTPVNPNGAEAETVRRVEARNEIARELAGRFGADIDDLHSPAAGRAELYSDSCHFKPEAVEGQARQVAEAVRKSLPAARPAGQ